jgi:hypothetical protein
VADEDVQFYDAAGNPPPGVYPADVCGFNLTTGAQREVLVAEGIRLANRMRRSQGIGDLRRPAPSTRLAAAPPAPYDDTSTSEEAEEAPSQRQAPRARRALRPRGSVGDQLAARGVDLILALATGRPALAAGAALVAGNGNGTGRRDRGRGGGRGDPAGPTAGY